VTPRVVQERFIPKSAMAVIRCALVLTEDGRPELDLRVMRRPAPDAPPEPTSAGLRVPQHLDADFLAAFGECARRAAEIAGQARCR
jgi:hypothetical protein